MSLTLVPLLFCPAPGVFTALLGDEHRKVDTPGAFLFPSKPLLDAADMAAVVALGHTNPQTIAAVFDKDGYGHTASLHPCGKAVSNWVQRVGTHTPERPFWGDRTMVTSWRWWVLRDGFVGLPYTDRAAFLETSLWANHGLPEGSFGVPVAALPGLDATAHIRLATASRVAADFALAVARDFPHARVLPPQWLS